MTAPIEWRMCACERALPGHVDSAPDPAGGTGCGMAWRPTADRAEIEELHVSDITHIGVQPGGHLRQDVPAGPALPNHPAVQTAERTRGNRMVGPPEQTEPAEDPRFSIGLLHDVLKVLEAHGYRAPQGNPRVYAHSLLALMTLVRAFAGRDVEGGGV